MLKIILLAMLLTFSILLVSQRPEKTTENINLSGDLKFLENDKLKVHLTDHSFKDGFTGFYMLGLPNCPEGY